MNKQNRLLLSNLTNRLNDNFDPKYTNSYDKAAVIFWTGRIWNYGVFLKRNISSAMFGTNSISIPFRINLG